MSITQLFKDQVMEFGHDWVKKGAAPPEKSVRLGGTLFLSEAGWLLLKVPNALVHGAFAALDEPGTELPLHDGVLRAHISVMRPEEIEEIGGGDKLLNDRGKVFHYTLGPTRSVTPEGWEEMSKCWFIDVDSPELMTLRKSYGLTPLPKSNEYRFHVTFAVKRKNVLRENEVSKTSEYDKLAELAAKLSQNAEGIEDLLQEARDETNTEPTEAQIEAGNFKKGKVTIHGFEIAIENPRGSIRSGTGKDGKHWENEMAHDYGYIRRTHSEADDDGLDVFIGPDLDSEKVFVINQNDPESGKFDEHKCCFGFNSEEEAKQGYLDCYNDGWDGFGDIKEMSLEEFKEWAGNGDTAKEAEWFKTFEEAEGIPSRKNYGDLSELPTNKLLDLIIQKHKAERAGEHYDFRFGDRKGLHSWATRKELPKPGKRIALFQQPLHSHKYKDFEGTIPKGQYGAGEVRKHHEGEIIITKMHPGMIHFTMASQKHPERFALVKPEKWGVKDWLLVNTTPTEQQPYEKVHYKKIPAEQVDDYLGKMQHGDSVEAKVDGASSLIKLLKDGVEVMSYRTSKQTGRPILYTEKLLGGGKQMKIPPELVGSVLKGETYGVRQGKRKDSVLPAEETIPPQELGGILNSSLNKSLRSMGERGIRLKNMVYDIQQLGKQHIDWNKVPRAERRKMMEDVLKHLPGDTFHPSEAATTPEAAKTLWESIRGGKHPLTSEGVVIWPHSGKPMKGKLTEDADVHVTNVFPGEGKYQGLGAGGFEYALEPGGPTIGRVGTGFSDELRRSAFQNPEDFVGRVARIRAQEQLPSGAYRAPSLIAMHEDIDSKTGSINVYRGESLEDLLELGILKEDFEKDSVEAAVPDQAVLAADIQDANAALMAQQARNEAVLAQLIKAKEFSDKGHYDQKRKLLRQLMTQAPQDWVIDQPESHHPGVTHVPTQFRLHTDRKFIPPQVQAAPPPVKQAAGSIASEVAWNTPIQYSGHRPWWQNVLDHVQKVRSTFRNRVSSKRFAHRLGMAGNHQAQLKNLQVMLHGQDPVLSNPTDVLVDKFAAEGETPATTTGWSPAATGAAGAGLAASLPLLYDTLRTGGRMIKDYADYAPENFGADDYVPQFGDIALFNDPEYEGSFRKSNPYFQGHPVRQHALMAVRDDKGMLRLTTPNSLGMTSQAPQPLLHRLFTEVPAKSTLGQAWRTLKRPLPKPVSPPAPADIKKKLRTEGLMEADELLDTPLDEFEVWRPKKRLTKGEQAKMMQNMAVPASANITPSSQVVGGIRNVLSLGWGNKKPAVANTCAGGICSAYSGVRNMPSAKSTMPVDLAHVPGFRRVVSHTNAPGGRASLGSVMRKGGFRAASRGLPGLILAAPAAIGAYNQWKNWSNSAAPPTPQPPVPQPAPQPK